MGEYAPDGYVPIFCEKCGNRIGWMDEDCGLGAYLCDACAEEVKDEKDWRD